MTKSGSVIGSAVVALMFLALVLNVLSSTKFASGFFARPNGNAFIFVSNGSIPESEVSELMEAWDFYLRNTSSISMGSSSSNSTSNSSSSSWASKWNPIPRPPHIEDCRMRSDQNAMLDRRDEHGRRPKWTLWKGAIASRLDADEETFVGEFSEETLGFQTPLVQGPLPPWIEGGDEDNLPMTRRVQRDLWLMQHPKNCSDPSLRFLLVDWVDSTRLGLGAQINAMAGAYSIAVRENRILVTERFNRASHPRCSGSDFERWSCYFAPETSCRDHVEVLKQQTQAWKKGTLRHLNSKDEVWFPPTPENWGKPWEHLQPSEASDGKLVVKHLAMDRKWWRAQVLKYWTRFPSEYLCTLLNEARHDAFGRQAARMVIESLSSKRAMGKDSGTSTMEEELLWDREKPWAPRPLLSIHVRQGDKASEMSIYSFESYMKLAQRARDKMPDLKNVWLSTEMQNVVDESKGYVGWNFFYTKIARQSGTTSMGEYERSLGTEQGSRNAFVNLLMALDCDHFVGVLGSTWSFLLNGLRTTSGKVGSGFLSVNLDRYWPK